MPLLLDVLLSLLLAGATQVSASVLGAQAIYLALDSGAPELEIECFCRVEKVSLCSSAREACCKEKATSVVKQEDYWLS